MLSSVPEKKFEVRSLRTPLEQVSENTEFSRVSGQRTLRNLFSPVFTEAGWLPPFGVTNYDSYFFPVIKLHYYC